MNNHKRYKIIENNIEYHTIQFCLDNKKDEKNLIKFTKKHKFTKLIDIDDYAHQKNNNTIIKYFKDGKMHNIFGPSIIIYNYKNEIISEYYYYNGILVDLEKWEIIIRREKLIKLNNID